VSFCALLAHFLRAIQEIAFTPSSLAHYSPIGFRRPPQLLKPAISYHQA